MILSTVPKPISQALVRFFGESSPRESADAERSLPIFKIAVISGTSLYSRKSCGELVPLIPRIFIASRIYPYSSLIAGKNLNITDTGTEIAFGIFILSIAAVNSLTVVVSRINTNIDIPGMT